MVFTNKNKMYEYMYILYWVDLFFMTESKNPFNQKKKVFLSVLFSDSIFTVYIELD